MLLVHNQCCKTRLEEPIADHNITNNQNNVISPLEILDAIVRNFHVYRACK